MAKRVRTTLLTYTVQTNPASISADITTACGTGSCAYWHPVSNPSPATSPLLLSLLTRKALTGQGPGSATEFRYDSRGNVLNRYDWNSTIVGTMPGLGSLNDGNSSWRHFIYDGYGNVTDATDPICTTTRYFYDSNSLYPTSIVEDYRGDAVGCSPQGAALTRTTTIKLEADTGL